MDKVTWETPAMKLVVSMSFPDIVAAGATEAATLAGTTRV
jgi:hypothetical protein